MPIKSIDTYSINWPTMFNNKRGCRAHRWSERPFTLVGSVDSRQRSGCKRLRTNGIQVRLGSRMFRVIRSLVRAGPSSAHSRSWQGRVRSSLAQIAWTSSNGDATSHATSGQMVGRGKLDSSPTKSYSICRGTGVQTSRRLDRLCTIDPCHVAIQSCTLDMEEKQP